MSEAEHPAVRAKMDIPFYKEGKEKPSLFSASDRNVEVALERALANMTIERGETDAVQYSDLGIKLVIGNGTTPVGLCPPLDQAIWVGGTRNQLYGVRGGYVYRLASNATVQASSRFTVPCFGDSSICYDSVNDKILCSFWNDQRGDDAETAEPAPGAKGIYKINPDTLVVEAFSDLGFGVLTGAYDGPHQLIFRSGKLYSIYNSSAAGFPKFIEVDPAALTITRSHTAFSGPDWSDIADDETNGLLWGSSADGQEIQSLDFATFASRNTYDPNAIIALPGAGLIGNISLDPVATEIDWSGGPFVPGYYLIHYVSGVSKFTDGGVDFYFADRHQTSPTINANFRKVFNGVPGSQTAAGFGTLYSNATDAHNAAAGNGASAIDWVTSPATATLGLLPTGFADLPWAGGTTFTLGQSCWYAPTQSTYVLIVASSTGDQPDISPSKWTKVYTVVEPYVFSLSQVYVYQAPTRTNVPYGICYAANSNTVFSTCRTRYLLSYGVVSGGFVQIDLGEADSFPYRCRYNPADGLVYVPCYKAAKVITVDPNTNAITGNFVGFDSPFDVVFTPGGNFAVQHGNVGLKPIA